MIEAYIERWSSYQGATAYRWSIWRDGRRIHMGGTEHGAAEGAEAEARAFCEQSLGQPPDQVTRL